jgi:hypothetical protein
MDKLKLLERQLERKEIKVKELQKEVFELNIQVGILRRKDEPDDKM